MVPEEIQEEGKHRGVGVLKAYLQFARDVIMVKPSVGDEPKASLNSGFLRHSRFVAMRVSLRLEFAVIGLT
jgi:hypothetical protein